MIFKNNAIYLIEGLFLIITVLIVAILFFTGPIPVKNITAFNSNLLLKITELNKDIRHIKRGTDKVIYYGALKPSPSQKIHFKQALNSLEQSLKRTDKQYKELDGFIKKNSAFLKYDSQITVYFNKSYFKWKNISRPILKIIVKHPKYISSRISYKLFLKHTLYLSHLPTANIIKDTKLYSGRFINIAIYTMIAGVIIILFLGILFFRYLNKNKFLEEKAKYISLYDPLTKLPNRSFFISVIDGYLGRVEYKGLNASLAVIDFYKLSYINNTYGYSVGDKLLQSFSKRLNKVMRDGDIAARVGDDKFGILFADLENKEDILQIIDRIKEEFKNPLYLDEISPAEGGNERKSFNVSFTMGISMFPDDGRNAGDLLKSADIALSSAKEQGEGEYEFFKTSMNTKASEFLLMKNSIINAFKNREFLIHYQPYFDIKTGKISGMEALARWNSPDAGFIPPVKFIPLLEKMGFIRQFEEFLIDKICGNLKEWEEKGFNIVPVFMNVSPVSFRKGDLIGMVVSALDKYGIGLSMLNIEITEGLFIQNFTYALKILNAFKEKGIKISLDDFGTGYSSLSYIKNIPADFIKIDISFIRGMIENYKDLAIVNAIVVLASKLGMKTIGEGVETEEQLEILKSFGCDMVQGYLFSKPVPEDEILRFLKEP
ncbi:MAG: bifunctional diguanylate cyclase/phosphodiesterase [Deltaproteobacteria bacterium]|nr:bifunctional diguanylate cyclase/phosphodiesterase [Deltaproteobacteria bacterium]